MDPVPRNITFRIEDEEISLKPTDVSPETTLNAYLRRTKQLTGTKSMCYEGGCGVCVVAVERPDLITGDIELLGVNSCLVSIFSCDGWRIRTIEGIGSPQKGLHPVQQTLALFNGTQCGFSSPGMIMNMYSLFEKGDVTMKEVENAFGGNICRCTGYRPILAAFKSLCVDADTELLGTIPDIEDIVSYKKCPISKTLKQLKRPRRLSFEAENSSWYKVFSLTELLSTVDSFINSEIMLVMGNTGKGVFRPDRSPEVYIDVAEVPELVNYEVRDNVLILGANMTLTKSMELFYELGANNPGFFYLTKMADHIDVIANVPVRNIGSLAGNLMLKYQRNEFQSDIFLLLEAAEAQLTILDTNRAESRMSPVNFLSFDMKGKVITNVILPSRDRTYNFGSYKIMGRAQNTHAMLNAGFLIQLDADTLVQSVRIVYGNINADFNRAINTERYLVGKSIYDNDVLQGAYRTLDAELLSEVNLPDPDPEFRKQLAIALFYKFILSIAPETAVDPKFRSGGDDFVRPISSGTQDYQTNESLYPLGEPISKIEAIAQTSGQAEYIYDIPDQPGQLYAAFVTARAKPNSLLRDVDTSLALNTPGVVAYFDKDDIPGRNAFTGSEEVFCSGTVQHYFQPVGLIVATSQEIASRAANLVRVTFDVSEEVPLLNVRQIIAAGATDRIHHEKTLVPRSRGTRATQVVTGTFDIGWQYHYHMETQCCNAVPTEDGLDLRPSTQGLDFTQTAVADVLNIPAHKINITVRRLGGGFGAKLTRNGMVTTAAALAAYKLNKPVKLWLPFTANMNILGKRFPLSTDYEIGVDEDGVIQYLESDCYSDMGNGGNENVTASVLDTITSAYNSDSWTIDMHTVRSDHPAGTYCRAPGHAEGCAVVEAMMEHIATAIGKDPLEVRMANLKPDPQLRTFIAELLTWADVDIRKEGIKAFNEENRWVKRGIAVVPMIYALGLLGEFSSIVSIYHIDGTVAICHGGIEMGQGLNTKAVQVAAYTLGIPLDFISVKPSNNLIAPNNYLSGGSRTSECICYATMKACQILLERIEPIKNQMPTATWAAVIQRCYQSNVDLTATFMYKGAVADFSDYLIYGVTAAEVEVDILSGRYHVTRVDLLEDTGQSLSPNIDIGQVEGAFIMGMGYHLTEKIVYNDDGELLTNRSWNYTPPGAKDIPIDFRVRFPTSTNPNGVLNSKATAEPPLLMTASVPLAIRNAVASARTDADGEADLWYPFDGPSTVDNTFMNSLNNYQQYLL